MIAAGCHTNFRKSDRLFLAQPIQRTVGLSYSFGQQGFAASVEAHRAVRDAKSSLKQVGWVKLRAAIVDGKSEPQNGSPPPQSPT